MAAVEASPQSFQGAPTHTLRSPRRSTVRINAFLSSALLLLLPLLLLLLPLLLLLLPLLLLLLPLLLLRTLAFSAMND